MKQEYLVLFGLPPGYSQKELDKAYRRLCRKVHPDMGGSAEEFHRVQQAYEYLSTTRETVLVHDSHPFRYKLV